MQVLQCLFCPLEGFLTALQHEGRLLVPQDPQEQPKHAHTHTHTLWARKASLSLSLSKTMSANMWEVGDVVHVYQSMHLPCSKQTHAGLQPDTVSVLPLWCCRVQPNHLLLPYHVQCIFLWQKAQAWGLRTQWLQLADVAVRESSPVPLIVGVETAEQLKSNYLVSKVSAILVDVHLQK